MKNKYIKTAHNYYIDIRLIPIIKYKVNEEEDFKTEVYTVRGYSSYSDYSGILLGHFENEQLCLEYIHEITEYKHPAYRGMNNSDLFKYAQRKNKEKEKANPNFWIIEEANRPD